MSARFHLQFVRVGATRAKGNSGTAFAVWVHLGEMRPHTLIWRRLGSDPSFDVASEFLRIRRSARVSDGEVVEFTVDRGVDYPQSGWMSEEYWARTEERLEECGGRQVGTPYTGRRDMRTKELDQMIAELKPLLVSISADVTHKPTPTKSTPADHLGVALKLYRKHCDQPQPSVKPAGIRAIKAAPVPAPGQGGRYYEVGVTVILSIHGTSPEDAQSHAADLLCWPSTTGRVLGAAHLEFEWCEELSDDELEEAALAQHLVTEGAAALQEESAS